MGFVTRGDRNHDVNNRSPVASRPNGDSALGNYSWAWSKQIALPLVFDPTAKSLGRIISLANNDKVKKVRDRYPEIQKSCGIMSILAIYGESSALKKIDKTGNRTQSTKISKENRSSSAMSSKFALDGIGTDLLNATYRSRRWNRSSRCSASDWWSHARNGGLVQVRPSICNRCSRE